MRDNQKAPQIRFSGFEKEYEKKQFDSVFDFISNNTLSRDNLNYHGGSTQNVHYGDILTKFGEYIDAEKEILPFLNDEEVALKYQNATLKDGDIIIADTAEDAMVGKCSEIGNIGDKKIISGLHTIPCRTKVKYASKYMGYYLNSEAYHHKLLPLMQGVKVIAISKSGIQGTELCLSQDYDEQKKIGEFFFAIDEKIKYEKQKLDAIKMLKKSMLTKMFPREGQSKPEIRFAGFNEAWEQRKLGELSSSFEYGLNAAAKEYDGENKYIRITDIDDDSREFKKEDITSPDTDLSSAENYRLSEGDILFARTGASVGKSYIYKASDGLVYYAGFLIRARIKPEYNSEFVFQNTLTGDYEKFIKVTSMRSGQPGVNAQEYSQYQIMVPSKPEQDKISDCLRNLDHLITLHQRELEKLENVKSACMKSMFV